MQNSTHILFSTDDLAILEHHLGPEHEVCNRVRSAFADLVDATLTKYRDAAMRESRDGELEIDPNAVVSQGDDAGAYVLAWLWIGDDFAGVLREEDAT